MKKTADSTRKLWQMLGLLALAILLVIVIDSLSFPGGSTTDALASGEGDTTSENHKTDSLADGETDAAPPAESTTANTARLTILGECAPGSPFSTTAYGSLNALAAEEGTDYFFSALRSVLASDDLTIAANTCVYADSALLSTASLCAAPPENASIYSAGSVEAIVDFADAATEISEETHTALSAVGVTVIDGGGVQFFETNGIRVALFTTEITKDTDHSPLLTYISEGDYSADYVILYFFGGEENSHTVETWLRNALYTYADTGVDLLIGAGNGVLRPCEYYGNSVIAYSLGSLIDGCHLVPENATALVQVELQTAEDGTVQSTVQFVPCFVYQNRWQPVLMTDEEDIDRVNRFLSGETQMPIETAG